MTSPDASGARPGRVAGLALLGLAAVALVIGLVTVFGGNGNADGNGGSDNADGEQPTSERPPTSKPTRPPTSKTTTTTTTTTTPPSSSTAPSSLPGGDNNGEPGKATAVRVLNNSKIKGLADRAADDLKASGWQVVEVGNFPGLIPTSTVYFRPDTGEEEAARALGQEFGLRVEPRFDGIQQMEPGLVVIVTQDYGDPDSGADDGKGK